MLRLRRQAKVRQLRGKLPWQGDLNATRIDRCQAAQNFLLLRNLGVTVRKTIDTAIATRCIESGYDLLHNDRDFDPFAKHLGLRVVV